MTLGTPDKVPLMCQLSIGHYFLNSGIDPIELWFSSEAYVEALFRLAERYRFDGILINLPGRPRDVMSLISGIENKHDDIIIRWDDGFFTRVPSDDNPHFYNPEGERIFPRFEDIDPALLYYIEPWDITEVTYPYSWGFQSAVNDFTNFFPDYHLDPIKSAVKRNTNDLSIHSEIFSPWSQFMELLNYESALMAIMDDPVKVKECLGQLTKGAVDLALSQADCGVDAILISSAFAGAGLISRDHYAEFVLPFEKKIVHSVQDKFSIPVYTHTCGSIGDRLDLMLETGTNGIDTLDPPPLGTVELPVAKQYLENKAFIKGNIDPVNTLLYGSHEDIVRDVKWRIDVGMQGGGFILSTACSVAPMTPPENIELLSELIEEKGKYML